MWNSSNRKWIQPYPKHLSHGPEQRGVYLWEEFYATVGWEAGGGWGSGEVETMWIFAAQRLPFWHQPAVMLGSHGNCYKSHLLPPQWCYLQTHMIGRCFHSLIERQGLIRIGVPLRPSPLWCGSGSLGLLSKGNILAYKVTLIKSSFSRETLNVRSGPQWGNEQSWYLFFCFAEALYYLILPFSLLSSCLPLCSAYPDSLSLSELKGTSWCLGSPDTLWRHQTLRSVWGCFCQGRLARKFGTVV